MAERFPLDRITLPVRGIADRLLNAGHEAWYVGGAVRDALLEQQGIRPVRTGDFDIATSARPEQVQALFRRTIPVGIEHGTVAVLDEAGTAHEVTTFRRDVKTDGRHAEVTFGVALDDDLARRDFTINAIAVHPVTGELRDPFGGRRDLSDKVLRAVGQPALRFIEDRLRVLRGLRFAAAFHFTIEPVTYAALSASTGDLEHLSRERVRDEWLKTLATSVPSVAVGMWRRAGALSAVWPELAKLRDSAELWLDGVSPRDPVLVTAAALAYALDGPDAPGVAEAAVRRLRFSNAEITRIERVVEAMMDSWPDPREAVVLRRWIARHRDAARDAAAAAPPSVPDRHALRAAVEATLGSGVPLGVGDLAVDGNALMAAGVPPGKAMGETLRRLLEVVLDDPSLNTREALLARVPPGA